MAKIKALRGYRYHPQKFKDLSSLIIPPYDVIDHEMQESFYQSHPYNCISLELGKKMATDSETNNIYTRAGDIFRKWIRDGILIPEDQPALYLYQQDFIIHQQTYSRTGFLCALKAEDYKLGQVLPHEETLPKHKADRLALMRASQANFSPIFGLYADQTKSIDRILLTASQDLEPDIQVKDWANVSHRLWVLKNPKVIEKVMHKFKDLKVQIADGHHRYETAVTYAKEMTAQGKKGFDYILINLVNLYDPGLIVLPTHRLVKNIPNFNLLDFLREIKKHFQVLILPILASKEATLANLLRKMKQGGVENHCFVLYGGEENLYLLIRDKSLTSKSAETYQEKFTAWQHLDVTILHKLILEEILQIGSRERASERFLGYTRDDLYALNSVDKGEFQFSLLMNPPSLEEISTIAQSGEKMPQKSTYFYPKVISGLIINKLGEA